MKNWKKPVATIVTATQVGDAIKAYAWTCINGYMRS